MAQFIDEELNDGSTLETTEVIQEPEKTTQEVVNEVPAVPEKYKGKSLEDIVRMHQEAEKLIGKQAQEVGEVRKLADELLKQQLSATKQQPTEEVESEIDFFVDPKKAVKKAVEEHPDVVEARKATLELKQERAKEALAKKHPDMMEIVRNEDFQKWVMASKVRANLFQRADQYDTDAADELFSTYKELRAVKTQAQNEEAKKAGEETRNQALKAATTGEGGTGETTRKVYRRADLIRLKMTDPDRYEAMQPEIMAAYAEGRVK